MLKNKNKILLTLSLLVQTIFAQTVYELDVHYGFGASELSFNSVPGFAISIYPVKNFGFSAGLQYSWRWQTKTNAIIDSTNTVDNDIPPDSLFFWYSIDKYRERLYGRILQVPLLLKYSNDLYYVAGGIKVGAVQKANASVSYSGLETEGHYSLYGPQHGPPLILTAPASQGFGTQKDSAFKTKISSKKLIMLALEGGLKLKLSDNFAMLAGIFADYSFNKGFNRGSKPAIERVNESSGEASLAVNDRWRTWRPWSIGVEVKFSFEIEHKKASEETLVEEPDDDSLENHNITAKEDIPIPSVPILPPPPEPIDTVQYRIDSITGLPEFALNREADYVFYYPEDRTSLIDSFHLALTSQMANILRKKNRSQLHCVGYSEELSSESIAYETAFQRALQIRFNLVRFYGIAENRIFIYSQGSKNAGYKRTECFVFDIVPKPASTSQTQFQ
ncbi:hypothetical protein R83H12_00831 [Fibrobacteria bacterium R8-3-H12]